MALRLFILAMLAAVVAMTANAAADGDTYPTPEDAAEAGLTQLIGSGWTLLGPNDEPSNPRGKGDVRYWRSNNHGDETFSVYSASAVSISDTHWWVGVVADNDRWALYDGGRIDLSYSRITNPDGNVISGWPSGNVDGENGVNSLDALMLLQGIAGAVERGERAFNPFADVDQEGGLTSRDALLILQYDAGLILGLPLRRGPPPFPDK